MRNKKNPSERACKCQLLDAIKRNLKSSEGCGVVIAKIKNILTDNGKCSSFIKDKFTVMRNNLKVEKEKTVLRYVFDSLKSHIDIDDICGVTLGIIRYIDFVLTYIEPCKSNFIHPRVKEELCCSMFRSPSAEDIFYKESLIRNNVAVYNYDIEGWEKGDLLFNRAWSLEEYGLDGVAALFRRKDKSYRPEHGDKLALIDIDFEDILCEAVKNVNAKHWKKDDLKLIDQWCRFLVKINQKIHDSAYYNELSELIEYVKARMKQIGDYMSKVSISLKEKDARTDVEECLLLWLNKWIRKMNKLRRVDAKSKVIPSRFS